MTSIVTIAQAGAVIWACWAIVSGVGAWKREFMGKRQIELAEEMLAKYFEVKDAVAYIRNPFSRIGEGKTRERNATELPHEAILLDRGYIVVERYQAKTACFAELNALKYRAMAVFGPEAEKIFTGVNLVLNRIFDSAKALASYFWQRQGRVDMTAEELETHLSAMQGHERIFWDHGTAQDEVQLQLQAIESSLDAIVTPCLKEPMSLFTILTGPLGRRGKNRR